MRKLLFLTILTIFIIEIAAAQTVQLVASAPNVVEVGEQFRLVYKLSAPGGVNPSGFQAPDLSNFDFMGPSTSTQMSTSYVNGKMTQEYAVSYIFIMSALKAGKFTIGAAKVVVGGKTVQSNTLSIEAVGSGTNTGGNTSNQDKNTNVSADGDLFVRLSPSKSSVYQGEHLLTTIKIYTKVDLVGFEKLTFPTYDGFWMQEIQMPDNIQLQRENVNGTLYNVGVLKKNILFPQKSGSISIDPVEIEAVIRTTTGRRDFFGFPETRNMKKTVKSPTVKINVKPLPENKPASFTGGVGSLNMTATIDKTDVRTNDAITLKISINGSGNLKLIEAPKVEFPPDFDPFDPKTNINVSNSANGTSGSKTFEYVIIPRLGGDFKIPPIEFSYFDLSSNSYKTIRSNEFNIHVEKGEGNENQTFISTTAKEDIQLIGEDIRYIKTSNIELQPIGSVLFGSTIFYLLYILPTVAFVALIVLRRKQIKERANVLRMKNRMANKVSLKRLKTASALLKEGKKEEFFSELLKALWGYLSDKLSIPVANLSREKAVEILSQRNVDEPTIKKFMELIDNSEFARYAPGIDNEAKETTFREAEQLIGSLEQQLK